MVLFHSRSLTVSVDQTPEDGIGGISKLFEGTNNVWGRRRLVTHGVYLWNDLPPEVKNSKSITCFKSSVRNLAKRRFKFYDTKT